MNIEKISPGGAEAMMKALKKAGLKRGMNVLEIGCGAGHMSRLIAERFCCRVTGVDKSRAAIGKAAAGPPPSSGNLDFLLQDVDEDETGEAEEARETSGGAFAKENRYDIICSECTLSLMRNRPGLLKKIYASLAPEGRLVLLDTRGDEMERDICAAGFSKIYEEDMSEELLSWAGQIIFEYSSLAAYFKGVTPPGEDAAAYCDPFARGYAMSVFGK
jgi:cyclopropane fatty-acyl-phospholipid synthase-like methyltransferase